jgi:hypothetical protein
VRTLLVPALVYDLDRWTWWPVGSSRRRSETEHLDEATRRAADVVGV